MENKAEKTTMTFQFYGYTLRTTTEEDLPLAVSWSRRILDAGFWLQQGEGRESFLVMEGAEPLAFLQAEHVQRDQVRLHWQPSPLASPKKLLRGITRLVPLMEAALSLRGVRAIFLTSHSLTMVAFMEKLGYRLQPNIDGGADGVVMAKAIASPAKPEPPSSGGGVLQEQNRANQEQSLERGSK